MVFHHLDDPNDPIRHGTSQPERAMIARSREWLDRQEPVHQARFCEHGSYVGHNRTLAYRCPRCPEQ